MYNELSVATLAPELTLFHLWIERPKSTYNKHQLKYYRNWLKSVIFWTPLFGWNRSFVPNYCVSKSHYSQSLCILIRNYLLLTSVFSVIIVSRGTFFYSEKNFLCVQSCRISGKNTEISFRPSYKCGTKVDKAEAKQDYQYKGVAFWNLKLLSKFACLW